MTPPPEGPMAEPPPPGLARIRQAVQDPTILKQLQVLCRYHANKCQQDIAEDLLQETIQQALSSGDRFDPTRSPQSWLCGIAKNVARKYARESTRGRLSTGMISQRDLEQAADIRAITAPELLEESETFEETRQILSSKMSQLSDTDQRIVQLRFFEQLKYEQIAIKLNLSSAAVRKRFSRASKLLQNDPSTESPQGDRS